MSRLLKVVSLGVLVPAFAAACATIMHGTSQGVSINSQPTGAAVSVDGNAVGTTPVAANLKRKSSHKIVVTMSGYQPYELVTTRKTSGWVWGNIVFGGLIGLIVDASTGGLYEVRPETVSAQLAQGTNRALMHQGDLYVILVPVADPSWTRIGQLTPIH
ncbi:MAG TPA: PEGA domain-containing protein [Gemmatimonadales bacterium]|jgi:hypothetical protein